MKEYDIKKVREGFSWTDINVLNIDIPYRKTTDEIKAKAQLCYNDKAILVHLSTEEKDIRAVQTGKLGMPCEDSCLEFFFSPMENDKRYFNIEFNFNGCMYLGFGSGLSDLTRLIVEPDEVFEPEILKTDKGWEIFYSIPYTFIRRFFPDFEANEGKTIRANCYKCADFSVPPHYLSWNKVEGDPFTFHKPSCFGIMKFIK